MAAGSIVDGGVARSRPAARRARAECRALGSRQGSPVAHGVASLEAPNGPTLRSSCRTAPKNTSALMDCFAKGSRWQDAFQLAFHMEEQGLKGNLITFNLLLNACERSSQWLRGLQLYQQMRRRDLRDEVSVNSSLGALVSATQWRRALQLWEEAETEPTEVTMNTLLMAYSSALQWQMALQCWQGFGLASSEATFGVLMDAMGAPGVDWRFSLELLNESGRRSRNVVTYTSAMKVLSRAQQWEKALKLFEEMQDMEVPPNALTVDVVALRRWQLRDQRRIGRRHCSC